MTFIRTARPPEQQRKKLHKRFLSHSSARLLLNENPLLLLMDVQAIAVPNGVFTLKVSCV